jgi:CheY-like chemotaxis protein
MPIRPAILIAEDSEEDAFILKRAFMKTQSGIPLSFVRDGQEAMDYLSGDGAYADRAAHPLPCLILLDLKMPKRDGFDVIEWVRKQPTLKLLPVTVFSSSNEDSDVDRAYALGANSYLVKPGSFHGVVDLIKKLSDYWVELNRRPSSGG